jgi:hypothetical protein
MTMNKPLQFALWTATLFLTAGCATYVPIQGSDAQTARLRISQTGMIQILPFIRPIAEDGSCGERFRGPALLPKAFVTKSNSSGFATTTSLTAPREGMFQAPPSDQTQTVELRLNPGRYRMGMTGSTGGYPIIFGCVFSPEVSMNAGEQYWLELKAEGGLCKANFSRVESAGNQSQWVPHTFTNAKNAVCSK